MLVVYKKSITFRGITSIECVIIKESEKHK